MLSRPKRSLALLAGVSVGSIAPAAALAQETSPPPPATQTERSSGNTDIVVTGTREEISAATKTDAPPIQTPQPITTIPDEVFLKQGALTISETLRYAAGVRSATTVDNRRDSFSIRGTSALLYRDGMREVYGFDNTIPSDPYNFSRVEVVRGPAGVLFGQGSIGGLVNITSKVPQFEAGGEVSLRYGSFNRKEALADLTGPISNTIAVRLVGRVRDADTQVDFVPDDRIMLAPSITWQPSSQTTLTVLGFYQEDDRGPALQFLPLDATIGFNEPGSRIPITPNPNGRLPFDTFVGEPGYDRFSGRNAQATALFEQDFGPDITLRSRARYIDSDVDYRTHYPNNYANPFNPWAGPEQRVIGRINYRSENDARVFTTDTNASWRFNTGAAIEHTLLGGVDYQWYKLRQSVGSDTSTTIDLFDPQYGNVVVPTLNENLPVTQEQLGFYLQDQIRLYDRVSVVLGVRHDRAGDEIEGSPAVESDATTFRAGIIGEIGAGLAPFFSYTESFLPTAGTNQTTGEPFVPQRGSQYEAGLKWQADPATLVTATAFRIDNTNRLIADPANPLNQIQTGEARSEGFEFEASRVLPGDMQLIAAYSYTDARITQSSNQAQVGRQLDNVPEHLASIWGLKTVRGPGEWFFDLGAGVRYEASGLSTSFRRISTSPLAFEVNNIVQTPDRVLVDAVVTARWRQFEFSINAVNLLNEKYYGGCLARGDCLPGSVRNVFGTATYRF